MEASEAPRTFLTMENVAHEKIDGHQTDSKHQIQGSYDEFLAFLSKKPASDDGQLKINGGCSSEGQNKTSDMLIPAASTGRCPFLHGTVYADPYPGYCHGNPNKGICPSGCRPKLNSDITKHETEKETLIREAMEYLDLYYHERTSAMKGMAGFVSKEERMTLVRQSIDQTGTYEHTFDELEHGARVAWRNAPKCSNRKYWQQLKLLDARNVSTNQGMFRACMEHLSKAMISGSSDAFITVFKPATPGSSDGPRIWNDQLLQYAAYRATPIPFADVGEIVGDPKNLRFTQMLEERFGWTGPNDGVKGSYDYLPLVVQIDPNEPPELFNVPLECSPPVFIAHHKYPKLSSLGMRWYPIPAVSALDLNIGGILYTAAPFNGWYANTEVVRDLTDEDRYNLLVPIGKALGFDVDTKPGEAPFWIDHVMSILAMVVHESFKKAKIAIVDHHTLINGFWDWYKHELNDRKYCPVNWKWVIPPMTPSCSPAYLGLNKAQEYTIKPSYTIGTPFSELETRYFGPRDSSKATNNALRAFLIVAGFNRMIRNFRSKKPAIVIAYASVSGNASRWADELGSILCSAARIQFVNTFSSTCLSPVILDQIKSSLVTIFVTSTQGNGELPSQAQKCLSFLFDENSSVFAGKSCSVLGFGSSAYPIFCGGAIRLSKMLAKHGAVEVIPRGECDAVKGEASVFYDWTVQLVTKLASMTSSPKMSMLSNNMSESRVSSLKHRKLLMDAVVVNVYSPKEIKTAAGEAAIAGNVITSRRQSLLSQLLSDKLSSKTDVLQSIIHTLDTSPNPCMDDDVIRGIVLSREDQLHSTGGRMTSIIKICLKNASSDPHYQPGDHVRIFPSNNLSLSELECFLSNLSGDISINDYIYVFFKGKGIAPEELAVSLQLVSKCLVKPQLIRLNYLFKHLVAVKGLISVQALRDLSSLTSNDTDKAQLMNLANGSGQLRWIDLFESFPSLSKLVSIDFLLCNMVVNHPRSYSIASCKEVVGSELHVCVGRFLYDCNGKTEAGICSDFLTSVSKGDKIRFKVEKTPSFHYVSDDPTSPIIFICTGTGYAPIRGLLMKREHLKSRGESLGPCYLIFGSRCSKEGLFHDEIKRFVKNKTLGKCFMAYSREPGEKKQYTSDRLRSDSVRKVLSPVLQRPNTHVFICGSAIMAEETKDALAEITSTDVLKAIETEGRLHCDVFGALVPVAEKNNGSTHDEGASAE